MPAPLLIQPPAICDDPFCLPCRINTLFSVAKALEERVPVEERNVEVEKGAVFTLLHAATALMQGGGMSLADQLAMFQMSHAQFAKWQEEDENSGLPRQTHNPKNLKH